MSGILIVCAIPVVVLLLVALVHYAVQGDTPEIVLAAKLDADAPAKVRRPSEAEVLAERFYNVTEYVPAHKFLDWRKETLTSGGVIVHSVPTMRGYLTTVAYRQSVRGGVL